MWLGEPLFNIVCCPTKSGVCELSKSNIFFGNLLPLFLENPITCLENPITFSGNPIIFLRNPIILFSGSCLIRAVSHGRVCVSVLAPSSSNVYSSSESDFLTNLSIFFRKSNIFFLKNPTIFVWFFVSVLAPSSKVVIVSLPNPLLEIRWGIQCLQSFVYIFLANPIWFF